MPSQKGAEHASAKVINILLACCLSVSLCTIMAYVWVLALILKWYCLQKQEGKKQEVKATSEWVPGMTRNPETYILRDQVFSDSYIARKVFLACPEPRCWVIIYLELHLLASCYLKRKVYSSMFLGNVSRFRWYYLFILFLHASHVISFFILIIHLALNVFLNKLTFCFIWF